LVILSFLNKFIQIHTEIFILFHTFISEGQLIFIQPFINETTKMFAFNWGENQSKTIFVAFFAGAPA